MISNKLWHILNIFTGNSFLLITIKTFVQQGREMWREKREGAPRFYSNWK